MTSEKDVVAQKTRAEKAEAEVKQLRQRVTTLENRIKVFDLDSVSDEDVKSVKRLLLEQSQEMDSREVAVKEREEKVNALEVSHKERERETMVQTLADKYAPKVEGDEEKTKVALKAFMDKIKSAEDPEKEALRLHVESLKVSGGAETTPAEEVHEHVAAGGKLKKSPLDMDEKELKEFELAHAVKV
uniref:Uncharacterized protein n=1 Tax=viral metagenome TaxID=1070528 RepID=A0A6M3IEV8_9ZZZZ